MIALLKLMALLLTFVVHINIFLKKEFLTQPRNQSYLFFLLPTSTLILRPETMAIDNPDN